MQLQPGINPECGKEVNTDIIVWNFEKISYGILAHIAQSSIICRAITTPEPLKEIFKLRLLVSTEEWKLSSDCSDSYLRVPLKGIFYLEKGKGYKIHTHTYVLYTVRI